MSTPPSTYRQDVAAWLAEAALVPPVAHNLTAHETDVDGSDLAAQRRGDYDSDWSQDRLAEKRAG